MKAIVFLLAGILTVLLLPGVVQAQDIGKPRPEDIRGLYPGETYSPYANRHFPTQVYWGEMHLHTGLSLDAGG